MNAIIILEKITQNTLTELGIDAEFINIETNQEEVMVQLNNDLIGKLFSISYNESIKVFTNNKVKKIKLSVDKLLLNPENYFIAITDLIFCSLIFAKKFKYNTKLYFKTETTKTYTQMNEAMLHKIVQGTVVKIQNDVVWLKITGYCLNQEFITIAEDKNVSGMILLKDQGEKEYFINDQIFTLSYNVDFLDTNHPSLQAVLICERISDKFIYNLIRFFLGGEEINIVRIARIPNYQTKVLVNSKLILDNQELMKIIKKNKSLPLLRLKEELGEKIQLIPENQDIKELLKECFAPYEVTVEENLNELIVKCLESNIKAIIGKNGSNVKAVNTLIQKSIKVVGV